MKILLWVYIAFVLACVVVVAVDPLWGDGTSGAYEGVFGTMATFAVGLPWTFFAIVLLRTVPLLGYYVYLVNPTILVALCWLCVPVNLLLLRYFRRKRADPSSS